MGSNISIRRAQVSAPDTRDAVRRFHAAVSLPDMALVSFFCSPEYDREAVVAELAACFGDVPVVGCTTAGEIGPAGYRTSTIAGASFAAADFAAVSRCIPSLKDFGVAEGRTVVQELLQELESRAPSARADNSFAFLMIDGLSVREEPVAHILQSALGRIPLVGGSAGDSLNFGTTWVYCDGCFRADSAVLVLVSTPLPFRPLMTQHFVTSDRRVVVTAADPARRIVHEIDGRPAAEAYAELVGVEPGNLDSQRFAASPLAVVIGGTNYVRSISKVLPDGSLKFFCAIDEGMVLRITRGGDLLANLEQYFAALRAEIGEPEAIIGCDCVLRRLEIEQKGLAGPVAALLERNRVVGFNTYGEQYRGVHVNQTFTGIAIGGRRAAGDD